MNPTKSPQADVEAVFRVIAREWLSTREWRLELTDPPLGEGAWAILIDLYANEHARHVPVSSACIASGAQATTALRWIGNLVGRSYIARCPDERDGRRILLTLTAEGRALVLRYLALTPGTKAAPFRHPAS